jgi:hypothetical protein
MANENSTDRSDIPVAAKNLLTHLRASKKQSYRLAWKGSKIPRGAKIKGSRITWTQHGCVYSESGEGEIMGYYTRTKEWAGEGKDEHEMIISTDYAVEAGPDQTAELVRDFSLQTPTTF